MNTQTVGAGSSVTPYQTYQVPTIQIDELKSLYEQFRKFQSDILIEGADYGKLAGVEKPCLYKPGAEKLRVAFGLSVEFERTETVEDLNIPYISYSYKATIYNRLGQKLAEQEGNCNSFETKYKYIWVNESDVPDGVDKSKLKKRDGTISEFTFAVDKSETTGKYGKPAEYWNKFKEAIQNGTAVKVKKKTKDKEYDAWEIGSILFRIINPEILGLKNTIMKMSQKRAFVGAMIMATGASDSFTQDLDDMDDEFKPAAPTTKVEPETKPAEKKETKPPLTKEQLLEKVKEVKTLKEIETLWNENSQHQSNAEVKKVFGENKVRILESKAPESPDDLIKPQDFNEEAIVKNYLDLLDAATDRGQAEKLLSGFTKDTSYTFISDGGKDRLKIYVDTKFPVVKSENKSSVVEDYKKKLDECQDWDSVVETAKGIVNEKEYKKLSKEEKASIRTYCEEDLSKKFNKK